MKYVPNLEKPMRLEGKPVVGKAVKRLQRFVLHFSGESRIHESSVQQWVELDEIDEMITGDELIQRLKGTAGLRKSVHTVHAVDEAMLN